MEKYKFFLESPFEISSKCCDVMKKKPIKQYAKETGRQPITAQMAEESRLRTQKWLQHGCNAFEAKNPISNPMSFWTEQDVLKYIKDKNLPICSVYGEVVEDYDRTDIIPGQTTLPGYEDEIPLKTTGCSRTGCMLCGFGCHLEKEPNRFQQLKKTHPEMYKLLDLMKNNGVTMREAIEWINDHGNMDIKL
jgi:3'-phosphoadenosine 5'-phosphosulfate sulfotransferase (PAPS reductase)/FAD synthetase